MTEELRRSERMWSALAPTAAVDAAGAQRQRIVAAMIACCAEKTYGSTTIADIVSGASISRSTFYKLFSGKRDCFDAAVDACVEESQAAARAAHTPSHPPAEAILEATTALLGLMAANPALAQLLTADAPTVEPAVVDRYRQLLIPSLQALLGAAGKSRRPPMDPRLAFGRAQLMIFHEIAAGRAAQLKELAPELVYLAVVPFAGHEEALRQSREAERRAGAETLARQ